MPSRLAVVVAGVLATTACAPGDPPCDAARAGAGCRRAALPAAVDVDRVRVRVDRSGQTGFDFVLTSPPQEHIDGDEWWTSYQPVSYLVESKLGTREEFADMVARCRCRRSGRHRRCCHQPHDGAGRRRHGLGRVGVRALRLSRASTTTADFHHCGLTVVRRHRGLLVARAGADVRTREPRRPRHRRPRRCGDASRTT